MTEVQIFALVGSIGFVLSFPIPFFARRFDKFLPADPGTALVRSFHIPRFAKSKNKRRAKKRTSLWIKLIFGGLKWGAMGAILASYFLKYESFIAYFLMIWICALLACIDEKIHILPDVLTFPLILSGFFFAANDWIGLAPLDSAVGALMGFMLPTLTSALMTPFRPRSLGGGDFKMLAGVGAWLGFQGLVASILISFAAFGLISAFKKSKEGPYGASLLIAVIIVMILKDLGYLDSLFVVL